MINNRLKEHTEGKINDLAVASHITHIFTDFFDTIVSRQCHPEEIKRKWCKHFIEITSIRNSTEYIYNLRLAVEDELATQSRTLYGVSEFRHIDMINKLLRLVGVCENRIGFLREKLHQIELEIEKRNQFLNCDVITFLEKQKILGRRVVVVSDFYCSKEFVCDLIKFHGIDKLIDKVYVSSDVMMTKRDANLFRYVLDRENVKAKNVIMVGDNLHSDLDMSRANGIFGVHVKRDFIFYEKSLRDDKSVKKIIKDVNDSLERKKSNFSWMSIPLFIFTVELYNKLKANSVKEIIFLAREGEFLKEIFDSYLALVGEQSISTKYMYASRRGTYLPSLYELDENCFDKFLNQYPKNNLETLLKTLSLDKYIDELKNFHPEIDFERNHLNLKASSDFGCLLSSETFKNIFYSESRKRRQYLNEYIDSLVEHDGAIHLVDVGWKGSIQDNIQKATNRQVFGYYCGLLSGAITNVDNIKYGLLFEYTKNICKGFSEFNEFRASFEVFCAASHGSTISYQPFPKVVLLEENQYEKELYLKSIRPIQHRLKNAVEDLFSLSERYSISNEALYNILVPIYFKRMMLPTNDEMLEFSKYKHYENFGSFDFSTFDEKKRSRIGYLKQLLLQPRHTMGSEWWKPLGFWNHGVATLKYPYYVLKLVTRRL
ncbi:HAD hydrolase-like protein [Vibrio cholerae]|uniref:HAD hydrolase-like protein n=1 Tax=Vibrio cholerae TaxID=666 RepID=UPI000C99A923|nr:HAD hydrolase-like protein [Vibrio cholerae]